MFLLSVMGRNAWGGVQYTVTDLGTLPGYTFTGHAEGINNSGQVVGWSWNNNNKSHSFLWQSGDGMQDLGTFGGTDAYASGINDNGQVVGKSKDSNGNVHAFLWQSSSGMQELDGLGGNASFAGDINDNGLVVGAGHSPGFYHAFLWQSGSGIRDLGTLGGDVSFAYGISNSEQVVGESTTNSSGYYHAFLWQSGSGMQDLGTFGGNESSASGINDSGQAVGWADYNSGYQQAFLWQSGSGMQALGTLGRGSRAWGINNSGQVVGDSNNHAFLWQSGSGMVDLNSLISSSSGWTLESANAINDNGLIVGYGRNRAGQQDAFLLTPVPEPSAIVLLSIGIVSIFAFIWRRQRQAAWRSQINRITKKSHRFRWLVWIRILSWYLNALVCPQYGKELPGINSDPVVTHYGCEKSPRCIHRGPNNG
jgi:probable HAF family extracellular repeat protein